MAGKDITLYDSSTSTNLFPRTYTRNVFDEDGTTTLQTLLANIVNEAGKIAEVKVDGTALTITNKSVNIDLSGYLPLAAGTNKKLTGRLYADTAGIVLGNNTNGANHQKALMFGSADSKTRIGADDAGDLGIYATKDLYLRPGVSTDLAAGLKMTRTNFSPTTTKSISLGSSSNMFNDIYGTTIYQNGNKVFDVGGGKVTGATSFTGTVGNTQTEAGIYLGLDTNTGAENANMAIVSANTASYIDMGRPNIDYDFRIIKWNTTDNKNAQFVYGGNASGTITIPQKSGTMALTSDIPSSSNFVTLTGEQTITGTKYFNNAYLIMKGAAADKMLRTRGISGANSDGTVGDLYLQYDSSYKTYWGSTGQSQLNSDGSISLGGNAKISYDSTNKCIKFTFS